MAAEKSSSDEMPERRHGKKEARAARDARLAEQLRANLAKRKAQLRARDDTAKKEPPGRE
jgi:hypothetical protein